MANQPILSRVGNYIWKSWIPDVLKRQSISSSANWEEIERFFGGAFQNTVAKITISPDTAMRSGAVYACVDLLSKVIASLPLGVYRYENDDKIEPVRDHPLYLILHRKPNQYQTSYQFRRTLITHMLLRGNHYCYKTVNAAGKILNLMPLDPARTSPQWFPGGELRYIYTTDRKYSQIEKYEPEEIWHFKDLSLDGIKGISRISYAKESIALAIAAERHGSAFFGNNATIGGIYTTPGSLSDQAYERVKKDLNEYKGKKSFNTLVLEEGLDFKSTTMSNEDSQFLETRQFQVGDIARIFGVPSILIGYADKAATYGSVEQQTLSFEKYTINPLCCDLEQSMEINLLSDEDLRRGYCIKFNMDGLLRGDIRTRYEAYRTGRQWGILSANDCRKKENMNPIEGGDIYLSPLNMVDPKEMDKPIDDPFKPKKNQGDAEE